MNGDERIKEKTVSGNRTADEESRRNEASAGEASTDPIGVGAGATEETDEPDWKEETEKYRDLFLRAQADMDNVKKRLEREKTELVKFANENLVKGLLPVLDNLERALAHGNEAGNNQEALIEGVRLTSEGLLTVLEKFGLKAVQALGERFDPNFHEAVMQREDPDAEDNSVVEEVQKGYLLHDRLVRPAMVVISRKPQAANTAD